MPVLAAQPSTLLSRTHAAPSLAPRLDEASALAPLVGTAPLADTPLAAGDAEVRLWYGAVGRWPHGGLVVRRQGGAPSAVAVRYWPAPDLVTGADPEERRQATADQRRIARLAGRACAPPRRTDEVVGCVRALDVTTAERALAALDSLEGWTVADEGEFGRRQPFAPPQGWQLRLEVRVGDRYRRAQWTNPDVVRGPGAAVAARAVALARLVDALALPAAGGR
jgi:hypothetical protein